MSHTYTANYFHCVFSTSERKNQIPAELQPQLWAYLIGTAKNLGIVPVAIGGTANHAHLLLGLKPTITVAEAIQKLKANSSRWLKEQGVEFEWQRGYGSLSVSPSQVDSVKAYVLSQEQHHRKRSFEEEFTALLQKMGIQFDPNELFAA